MLCILGAVMNAPTSHIRQVVDHIGGPVATSKALGGVPAYQEVSRWVERGWASPHHIFRLEPLLPAGVTVRDLFADKEAAKRREKAAAKAVAKRKGVPAAAQAASRSPDDIAAELLERTLRARENAKHPRRRSSDRKRGRDEFGEA
jgi:hypothetical protein